MAEVGANGIQQSLDGWKETIGAGRVFEVPPVPFDRVQIGTVCGQKERDDLRFKDGKACLCGEAVMIGGVVQDQHDGTVIGDLLHQGIEEGDEGIAILLGRRHSNDFIGEEVVGAEQMMPLLLPRCIDALLGTLFHPTGTEDRV